METFFVVYLCLMGLYAIINGAAWIAVILDTVFNLGWTEMAQQKQAPRPRLRK